MLAKTIIGIGVLALGLGAAGAASAQQTALAAAAARPAPACPATPRGAPYGPPITLEQAKTVLAAAEAEARRRNVEPTIAIVEPTGELVLYEKATSAQYAAYEFAYDKARTAARYRRETKVINDQVRCGDLTAMTFPGAMAAGAGGVPIFVGGKIIGAIGETGGSDQDVATAGAQALK
jgi:uncharacterized protein GlcG (DUF336 family)